MEIVTFGAFIPLLIPSVAICLGIVTAIWYMAFRPILKENRKLREENKRLLDAIGDVVLSRIELRIKEPK